MVRKNQTWGSSEATQAGRGLSCHGDGVVWGTVGGGTRSFACPYSVWDKTPPLDPSAITAAAYLLSQIFLVPLHHQVARICWMAERCQGNPEVPGFRLGRAPLRRKTKVSFVPSVHFQGFRSPLVLFSLGEASSSRAVLSRGSVTEAEMGVLRTRDISGEEEAYDCPTSSCQPPGTMNPENPLESVVLRHCLERMAVRAHEDGRLEPMTIASPPFRDSGKEEGRACPLPTEWDWKMSQHWGKRG